MNIYKVRLVNKAQNLDTTIDCPEDKFILEAAEDNLERSVRESIGAIASYKTTFIVKRLPKTRSGKILRATLRKIADGKPFDMPSTIEDPSVLDEIRELFSKA